MGEIENFINCHLTNIRQSFYNKTMMQINWQGQSKRKKRAYFLWKQFVDEYNSGKSAQEIADSYVNPKTGKNYTRAHVYWVLQQMKNIDGINKK